MRYLYFACISLYLLLFSSNHAHARIRESYEDSVARYTAAGFTEERTTVRVPRDDKNCDWYATRKSPHIEGYKEVTWTNKNPDAGSGIVVISIRQLFYGRWSNYLPEEKWRQALHCHEITYEFKDSFDDPRGTPEIKLWVEQLVKNSLERFKPSNGWDGHGMAWYHSPKEFVIDPTRGESSSRGKSRGKFHTGGKCLTILLDQSHWSSRFGSISSKLLNPPLRMYFDPCWGYEVPEVQKKPTQYELAERERQRQKELQRIRDAAAKEIEESGL